MNESVYFVILHYQTVSETTQCVSSIINNIEYDNKHIIIVDNSSPNKSGTYLKEYYKYDKNIEVIINKENLGFAKGNNIGYAYARNERKVRTEEKNGMKERRKEKQNKNCQENVRKKS